MPNALLNIATLNTMLTDHPTAPVVSLYVNIDPADRQHTRLRVQELLRQAKTTVIADFGADWWTPFEHRLTSALSDDTLFAQNIKESLGVLATSQQIIVDHLLTAVEDHVSVATTPELRPLLFEQQTDFDFDLLALNGDSFRLYQIQNHRAIPMPLPDDAPTTLTKALGDQKRGGDLNAVSRGDHAGFHGHNSKDAEKEIDLTNYYKAVEDFMQANHQQSTRPLILFALPENQALYRRISRLARLSTTYALQNSPAGLTTAQIQTQINPLFEHHAHLAIDQALNDYQSAANANRQLNVPSDIATAACQGQVETFIVSETSAWHGTLTDDQFTPTDDGQDILPTLCTAVLQNGGQVVVVPEDQLPDGQPVAISRY
ncbi:hypothetical protein ACRYI5_07230 [Furfurilactobacillus sp. WILCCON 0119]|uniref:baeRF6 domain-containing protein n=1 Tax=Furfurilactobacillus entadae TaxID=2922307 RepID=UPI0035EDBF60